MKMTALEKLLIRSPLRVFIQRKLEAPKVLGGLNVPTNCVCLEIGSGVGAGALLINQYLDCKQVIGIDIDPDMIKAANRYIYRPPRWAVKIKTYNIEFIRQNAEALSFDDGYFDAVILFGVLDHIENWRKVITEVFRVLKTNGVFSFEEFLLKRGDWGGHVAISGDKLKEALTQAGFDVRRFEVGKFIPHCYVRAVKKTKPEEKELSE